MTNLELCGLLLSVVILAAAGCANTASAGERVWHSFCGTGTSCPAYSAKAQGLIFESGNLYGVAGGEGTGAAGVIFEWGPTSGSGQYTALYNFCPNNLNGQVCTDGDGPEGKLIMDSSGNLYGVTRDGGATTQNYPPGYGEIYWISPSASPPVVHHLWDFCSTNPPNCPEGNHPDAGLTYVGAATGTLYDGSSPLFGTTISGGANGAGTVFKLIPGGTPTAIANFCSASSCVAGQPCSAGVNCLPGQLPNAIIADSSGNLYGTTQKARAVTRTPRFFTNSRPPKAAILRPSSTRSANSRIAPTARNRWAHSRFIRARYWEQRCPEEGIYSARCFNSLEASSSCTASVHRLAVQMGRILRVGS